MKRYNLINDILGWFCFVVAAVTYLLTLEPTASFWDCPEFITQGYKLEIGHPPGNPIFMLTARFFVDFVGSDVTKVAVAVNSMSALLSAATILLLFWTITHLVRRLVVRDDANEVSLTQMLVIFGSGLCGALMYAWSDTFWFSAVEGEVYAFSSFCTALVFWLILKWENRADQPHSDRYLVLIAYVIGISIAVHLLNLLCIPAIVLVFYYRKWRKVNVKGSLIALLVSFALVAVVLYGLVPGFIKMAQYFELLFVNGLHMPFNAGALIYAIAVVALFIVTVVSLYKQKHPLAERILFAACIVMSGIPLMVHNEWLALAVSAVIFLVMIKLPRVSTRVMTNATLSLLVIFIGYSSYALLIIRSSAETPMNQNSPDNVFALSSYLNREQYGDRPLLYGITPYSGVTYAPDGAGSYKARYNDGPRQYAKAVKASPDEPDSYKMTGYKREYQMAPELNMLFPRIYSSLPGHIQAYTDWVGMRGRQVEYSQIYDAQGNPMPGSQQYAMKPTMTESLQFFLSYQLNYMYWRYFMWNFAGRQNDIQGNGEVNHGNWLSGIPAIDNARLGDQSLLPYDEGEGNKGHNVFFMLPLIMGIIGLLWQAFVSKRGIEQFWVVFFLFFMTGIAIVIYLNQTPQQPRERDYAYAGSFYAYAIWVGMGVAGLSYVLHRLFDPATKRAVKEAKAKPAPSPFGAAASDDDDRFETVDTGKNLALTVIAALVGIFVPLQVVSQTWDDHDRSGRYTTRDFGANYLNSLAPNAVIFTNGDNDTFPLWYAQEVEGVRTDVKVVNLSYLTTDWYANQIRMPSYDAKPLQMMAQAADYAFDQLQYNYVDPADSSVVTVRRALEDLYSQRGSDIRTVRYPRMYLPIDAQAMVKAGRITEAEAAAAESQLTMDFSKSSGLALNTILALDILNSSAENGWDRPVYFAMTVPDSYYLGLSPVMRSTGLAYEVGPIRSTTGEPGVNSDVAYENITTKFAWGGLDQPGAENLYLDETVRRMVSTNRTAMLDLASQLVSEGSQALRLAERAAVPTEGVVIDADSARAYAADRFDRARNVLTLMEEKLPASVSPLSPHMGLQIADIYQELAVATNNTADLDKAIAQVRADVDKYARNFVYYSSLTQDQFASLQNTDKYIYYYYFPDVVRTLASLTGDYDAVERYVSGLGVNPYTLRQLIFGAESEQAPAPAADEAMLVDEIVE